MQQYELAVLPGDGIGNEVMPEALRVLDVIGAKYGVRLGYRHFDWSCETYQSTRRMMPADGLDRLRDHDSIPLGAVGWPDVPDHISLWGLLLPTRREFDQYVNLRPVRLLPGVIPPVRDKQPGDIDFWVVRENTEAEYSQLGGRLGEGTPNEMMLQTAAFTRRGTDRIMR